MLSILRDLVQHKWNANSCLLRAIGQSPAAAGDAELRRLMHHILVANRFWFALSAGRTFALEEESTVPESLEVLTAHYRETCMLESGWFSQIQETELARALETSYIPGYSFSVAEAMMQVCMHSHGHRAQCATRLRLLGGEPPAMDFIAWLKERPAPVWS
jgi:uncharacterized damage-inducible protein DinB